MSKIPRLRPKITRPLTRGAKASYFQMHVYDQEQKRLEAERNELRQRLGIIERRVGVIREELQKLEQVLKRGAAKSV